MVWWTDVGTDSTADPLVACAMSVNTPRTLDRVSTSDGDPPGGGRRRARGVKIVGVIRLAATTVQVETPHMGQA